MPSASANCAGCSFSRSSTIKIRSSNLPGTPIARRSPRSTNGGPGRQTRKASQVHLVTCDAFRVCRPGPPLVLLGDRRAIGVPGKFELLILIVDDLEKEHPAQLADALGIAINAYVLAHNVLNRFYGVADGHFYASCAREKAFSSSMSLSRPSRCSCG